MKANMREFSLEFYEHLLLAFKQKYTNIITFNEFLENESKYQSFLILRHDVDRKPKNALEMAQLEYKHGIRSTYYFRTKRHTLKQELIQVIASMGHEVGYHYESLTDCNGDYKKAYQDFGNNLSQLRKITPVNTISMHGSPLSPYDNRDLWKTKAQIERLKNQYALLGEIYLAIDYKDILYITDTGRNWKRGVANRRDTVVSDVYQSFDSGEELLTYINNQPHNKFVFQTHPERWTDNNIEWKIQNVKDSIINIIKNIRK